jgi:fructose/tagatose bisphosphate aldolase
MKDRKKVKARLNLDHLERLHQATGIPLVLHGGSGIKREYLIAAIQKGIAKVNVGTEIRQAYELALRGSGSVPDAQDAVHKRACWLIGDYFDVAGTRRVVTGNTSKEDAL